MVITSEQYNELRYWTEVRKFTPWQVAHTMGLPVDWVKFLTSISK